LESTLLDAHLHRAADRGDDSRGDQLGLYGELAADLV
jgi:hypothetical protein